MLADDFQVQMKMIKIALLQVAATLDWNLVQIWNVTDKTGKRVENGLFLYNISFDSNGSQINRLLINTAKQ